MKKYTKTYWLIVMFMITGVIKAQTVMKIYQNNGNVIQVPLNTIDSITYSIGNPGTFATIQTSTVSSITPNSAICGGDISNNGGTAVTHRGVAWSTNPNPTTADSVTIDGNGIGSYISLMNGLSPNTTYYVRAYAINSAGTSYGNELSFTTNGGTGTITTLNCANATNTGTLKAGTPSNGVSSSVPYSGGVAGTHLGQVVMSTGVNGLTATLTSGNINTGNGSLVYTITGTPNSAGTANFGLNIGGQSCILNLIVDTGSSQTTYPIGSVFCTGNPTTVIDVTSPQTGNIWMDRNLGASRAATSSTDAAAYGDLYQWGRMSDGHQCRNSSTTPTLSSTDQPGNNKFILSPNAPNDWRSPQNDNLWQGVTGINNPCPTGYRLPTTTELDAERASWANQNSTGAFGNVLKLPLAGSRSSSNGNLNQVGTWGLYWTSSTASYLFFTSTSASMLNNFRANGVSVRCIKDKGEIESLDCDHAINYGVLRNGVSANNVSLSVPYGGGHGGSHNGQTVSSTGVTGLIATLSSGSFNSGTGTLTYNITGTPNSTGTASFALNIGGQSCVVNCIVYANGSSGTYPAGSVFCNNIPTSIADVVNPTTGKTWMDRNLGASQVATSSGDAAAYGDLYQWGRGSDGHQCRNSATTSTLSSTDQPGHGSFIIADDWRSPWRSPQNNNLWQGVNGVNNPCPIGYRIPTKSEFETERNTWANNDAFNSILKLPSPSTRRDKTGQIEAWSEGNYWTSTIYMNEWAYRLRPNENYFGYDPISHGYAIRCIKD
jgi:uncharacterized protein (TIGR02145 family)